MSIERPASLLKIPGAVGSPRDPKWNEGAIAKAEETGAKIPAAHPPAVLYPPTRRTPPHPLTGRPLRRKSENDHRRQSGGHHRFGIAPRHDHGCRRGAQASKAC